MGRASPGEQIIAILRQAEGGVPVAAASPASCPDPAIVCLQTMRGNASFDKWRAKHGGMDASVIADIKAVEEENRRLKKVFAEL